jgi:hypothetical protein
MSLDYTRDYSNHVLLDNKAKYSKIYKIAESDASDIEKGDLILLKTPCGKWGLFIALSAADEDGTLHLSKYTDQEFISFDSYLEQNTASSSITTTSVGGCGCV